MKPPRECPSIWHVIVTLFAMLYFSSVSTAVMGALVHNYSGVAMQAFGVMVTLLVVLTWLFLFCDLIRQISLFFRRVRR